MASQNECVSAQVKTLVNESLRRLDNVITKHKNSPKGMITNYIYSESNYMTRVE